MNNQGNMRLHVDLFIKYVSNNVYSDNNHGQPQSILNIFLTFLVAYTLWQPFVAYFRSDIDIIVFFCWAGWKWVGRRDCLTKKILPHWEPKGGRSGRWETHKKYGHPYRSSWMQFGYVLTTTSHHFSNHPPPMKGWLSINIRYYWSILIYLMINYYKYI